MIKTTIVWTTLRLLPLLALLTSGFAQTARQASIEVLVQVSALPPTITLSWPLDPSATGYTIARRLQGSSSFGPTIAVPGGATASNWTDSNVQSGLRYEYWLTRTGNPPGRIFVSTGIHAELEEDRGRLLLIVDATRIAALGMRLDRLEEDLMGDGYEVRRIAVQPTDSVTSVKALIQTEYALDPGRTRAVFLLGRIPVPYSGSIAPDGHPDHRGAWPADVYYGDVDGAWTDSFVNVATASRTENRNIPGDGKFDQSSLPSDVELMVGRVDFANLPAFGQSEETLLQNYLDKNHAYRHGQLRAAKAALIDDNFGWFNGEAFSASGWRNFTALLGPGMTTAGDYFGNLNTTSGPGYQWSYGCGGGNYRGASGVGSTSDFANSDNRSVFTILFGSYFGDWDSTDNFLRAPLASGWTLASFWAGRPHWSLHPMGLGAPLGFAARMSQNESFAGGFGARSIHIALMGDPSLREHVLAPPSGAEATIFGPSVQLRWQASRDPVLGYHVYRASDPGGPFQRLTAAPIADLQYTDFPQSLQDVYMIRAIALTQTPTGSFWNASQGLFARACTGNEPLAQVFGQSCGNPAPSLAVTAPRVGAPFEVQLQSAAPLSPGILALGAIGAPTPVSPGCDLLLDLATLSPFQSLQTDANGAWNFQISLPSDPALICLSAALQAAVVGPTGLALSNAVQLRVGL